MKSMTERDLINLEGAVTKGNLGEGPVPEDKTSLKDDQKKPSTARERAMEYRRRSLLDGLGSANLPRERVNSTNPVAAKENAIREAERFRAEINGDRKRGTR